MDVQDRVRATTDPGDGPGGRRVRRRLDRADQRDVQPPHAEEHRLRLHQSEQRGPDTKLVEWRHVPDAYSFDRIHDEYALYGPGPRERRGRGRARRGARPEPLELHDGGGTPRGATAPPQPAADSVSVDQAAGERHLERTRLHKNRRHRKVGPAEAEHRPVVVLPRRLPWR